MSVSTPTRTHPLRARIAARSTLTHERSFLRASEYLSAPSVEIASMASNSVPIPKLDRYVVIHVATTCDEHGVYVTKDSAEVIELGWILLDSKNCDEVRPPYLPAVLPLTLAC